MPYLSLSSSLERGAEGESRLMNVTSGATATNKMEKMASNNLSLNQARRIALAAQGIDRDRPHGRVGVSHLRRVLRQLGLVQIDYVNVLVPAHYQVFFSRLGPYDKAHLHNLVYRRREFTEQWAHEASIVPME